jgi:hypothetical protein
VVSPGILQFLPSIKTYHHNISEILLKVVLNFITPLTLTIRTQLWEQGSKLKIP